MIKTIKMKTKPGKTTIQISDDLWKTLNDLKKKPSESFEDVLTRLVEVKKWKLH